MGVYVLKQGTRSGAVAGRRREDITTIVKGRRSGLIQVISDRVGEYPAGRLRGRGSVLREICGRAGNGDLALAFAVQKRSKGMDAEKDRVNEQRKQ